MSDMDYNLTETFPTDTVLRRVQLMSDNPIGQRIETLQQWVNTLQYRVITSSESLDGVLAETLEGFLSTLEELYQQTQVKSPPYEVADKMPRDINSFADSAQLVQTFGRIFLALTTKTNRDAILDEIINQIQNLISYSAANIMLLEENALQIVRHHGYEAFGGVTRLSGLKQSLSEFPLDAQVINGRESLVVPDTHKNPLWVITPQGAWVRSFIAIPICLQDRVLGLFRLDSDVPGKFSYADIPLLIPLAGAAAVALENARLYDQVQQELLERSQAEEEIIKLNHKLVSLQFAGATIAASLDLQQVLEVITSEMRTLLDVDKCIVYGRDQESAVISNLAQSTEGKAKTQSVHHSVSLGDLSITRQVLETPEALKITLATHPDDLASLIYLQEQQAKTILLLPMEFQEQVVGLVEIIDQRHERNFSIDEIAIAQLVANQAASAIQNAYLYQQAKKEVEERKRAEQKLEKSEAQLMAELQSILAINNVLVTKVGFPKLFDFIIAQAEKLTGASGAAVLLLDESYTQFELTASSHLKLRQKLATCLPLQGAIADQAIKTRQVQISNEVSIEKRATPICDLLHPAKIHSLLCAPLITSNDSLGVLLLWHTNKKGQFSSRDGRLIGMFANQAALALQNVQLNIKNRQLAIRQERNRLARELHDTVTQSLYSIALSAKTSLKLLDMSGKRDEICEPLNLISTLAQEALTEMREQIYELASPASANIELATILARYRDSFSSRYGLEIDLIMNPELSFNSEQQEALSCITREALWNVVKHAGATHVEIDITSQNGQIELSIQDNGIGLESPLVELKLKKTMGLSNMMARAKQVGGYLKIQSRTETNYGTRIITRIPASEPRKLKNGDTE